MTVIQCCYSERSFKTRNNTHCFKVEKVRRYKTGKRKGSEEFRNICIILGPSNWHSPLFISHLATMDHPYPFPLCLLKIFFIALIFLILFQIAFISKCLFNLLNWGAGFTFPSYRFDGVDKRVLSIFLWRVWEQFCSPTSSRNFHHNCKTYRDWPVYCPILMIFFRDHTEVQKSTVNGNKFCKHIWKNPQDFF